MFFNYFFSVIFFKLSCLFYFLFDSTLYSYLINYLIFLNLNSYGESISISFNFFLFFSVLAVLAAFMVIFARNPIHSIFFLILSFISVSALLFILKSEFLAIVFLIVYVGAISVLFLFVVMMLNIKKIELIENFFNYLPIGAIICFLCFTELYFFLCLDYRYCETIFTNISFSNSFVINELLFDFFSAQYQFYADVFYHSMNLSGLLRAENVAAFYTDLNTFDDFRAEVSQEFSKAIKYIRSITGFVEKEYFFTPGMLTYWTLAIFIEDYIATAVPIFYFLDLGKSFILNSDYSGDMSLVFSEYLNEKLAILDIENICLVIYDRYFLVFLLAAFILLVAMLGAIVLTLNKKQVIVNSVKRQQISAQVFRTVKLKAYSK